MIRGRFLTKDPIGFAGGQTNLYSYIMNDPVNFTDPTGLIVNDQTAGGIPAFIRNGSLYAALQSSAVTVNISYDYGLGAAGKTTPVRNGQLNVYINPNNQKSVLDLYDTILHELNHAQINISTNNAFSMGGRRASSRTRRCTSLEFFKTTD